MAHYAVGSFESGRSGSPYQFVCKKVYPAGPFALLDTYRRKTIRPQLSVPYLFELEDWHSTDPRSQYVTQLIAPLQNIARTIHDALLDAQWEMVVIKSRWQLRLVGKIIKTEFGYFEPEYHSGLNAFGPGQDVDPYFMMRACPRSEENPYGDALGTELARRYLPCLDETEIERVKFPSGGAVAKDDLGELFRKHHGF